MSDAENLARALEPKSDQLNADDLVTGPITIKIRKMEVKGEGEQRISVYYDGDNGKPYKPGKSMGRVMVQAWGANPHNYIGRSMTLYCDPTVKWAGMEVGGIRISHMSDIKSKMTFMLTATKGNKKPYVVQPLVAAVGKPGDPEHHLVSIEEIDVAALKKEATEAAKTGTEAFKKYWTSIGASRQRALGDPFKEELKAIAAQADTPKTQPKVIIDPSKINLAGDPAGAATILAEGLAALPEADRKAAFDANFGNEIASAVTDAGGTLPEIFLTLAQ